MTKKIKFKDTAAYKAVKELVFVSSNGVTVKLRKVLKREVKNGELMLTVDGGRSRNVGGLTWTTSPR